MTIKSENPLPRYAFGQKSVTDTWTDRRKGFIQTDNTKTIFPLEIFWRGITITKLELHLYTYNKTYPEFT